MKSLLRSEELAQLLVCILTLVMHQVPWWAYILVAVGPDIGMAGYLAGPRTGAFTYNLLHHKGIALLLAGISLGSAFLALPAAPALQPLLVAGIILYGHACMDRMLGYGLKFGDGFAHTHLGWTGHGPKAD